MKSASSESIDQFWRWFSKVAERLAANVEDSGLLSELDARLLGINPHLSWEVGPGLAKPWQLVVSPNLDQELRATSRLIVSRAPLLDGWEFHAARQPKAWDYHFALERGTGESVRLDAASWTFVLLRHPDGAHEILLKSSDLPPLSEDERWQAAAVVLESILGEDVMMDKVGEFELVDQLEPRFAEKARPIRSLQGALSGAP